MRAETDSIPRTTLKDLFVALSVIAKDSPGTLEILRQRFCVERRRRIAGDLQWSTAAANAEELKRLGLLAVSAIPKNKKNFERLKDRPVTITDAGARLYGRFKENRADAYDHLFTMMYEAHPYMRAFVRLLNETHVFAPVMTSLKDHISPKYTHATALVEDVSRGEIDLDSFLILLEGRIKRPLANQERLDISEGISSLVSEVSLAAASDEPTEFAKKFLLKTNEVVFPSIFKREGLTFDYRTHRILWSFGQEWKLWQATGDHPEYDGRLVFRTATIQLSRQGDKVELLSFDSGLAKMRENFLDKLYDAFLKVQRVTKGTYALAWQLRAVFCFDNRCQDSVFDRLMDEHYIGSDQYDLTLEIQRQHGQFERPLRVGGRNIGLVRVLKK
ncbi:MAG TPA: hypothetical protein VGN95_02415 [Pyrinomonadaceae bacterium]|jgi:hypothetical protein|nr:hypothetical protein [Pyrinomonadaceae bacterium]